MVLIILLDCCGVGFPVVELLVVELLLTKLKANGAFLTLFKSPKTQQQGLFLLIKMNFFWALLGRNCFFKPNYTCQPHYHKGGSVHLPVTVQTLVLFLSAGWRHLLVGQCKKEKENSSHIILLTKFGFSFPIHVVLSYPRKEDISTADISQTRLFTPKYFS